ncbi:hypothetical protein M0R45_031318 [Rubus argutus]|uniref:Uncharacterized protein n=1 Tax=Rubus argutus TaxID=59490 RepID=A0AAW1WFH9_RUBAR
MCPSNLGVQPRPLDGRVVTEREWLASEVQILAPNSVDLRDKRESGGEMVLEEIVVEEMVAEQSHRSNSQSNPVLSHVSVHIIRCFCSAVHPPLPVASLFGHPISLPYHALPSSSSHWSPWTERERDEPTSINWYYRSAC